MSKHLGKLKSFDFIKEDGRIGIRATVESNEGGALDTSLMAWSPSSVEVTEHTKWTENDRDSQLASIFRKIDSLMEEAKVTKLTQMAGIPIEIEFENSMLKSWRILTEVL